MSDSKAEKSVAEVNEITNTAFRTFFPEAEIGPESDFFELGGDSLAAAEISVYFEEKMGFEVHPAILFETSLLEEIAMSLYQMQFAD